MHDFLKNKRILARFLGDCNHTKLFSASGEGYIIVINYFGEFWVLLICYDEVGA